MSDLKASGFDRFLAAIAPGMAAKRMAKKAEFNFYAGGYDAVQTSRFRTHQAWNRSRQGTEDNLIGSHDRQSVRLECLDLWRNNEIVRGLVERFVDYSVADGIWPQAQTTDPKWNQLAETWWKEIYVPTADYRNISSVSLINHQQFVVSDRILSGDIGFIMLKNGQLQPIESPRIATPQDQMQNQNVVEGVKRTAKGIVTGYYVCPRKNDGGVDNTKAKFIPAANFIHCYRPGRADQLRGVAELAPAVNKLRDYDTTDQFVLNKIKNDASILTVKTKGNKLANERNRNAYILTDENDQDPMKVEKRDWGNEITLNPGEEYNSFDGKAPNNEYVPYLEHELKAISACMNLPYEFLMLIFTQGSYSAQRAAMLHAQKTFTDWHQYVIGVFLRRVWNWRIAKAIKEGVLPPAPVDEQGRSQWWNVEWSLPHFGWIDPLKQVQAQRERIRLGVTSLELETRSEGKEVGDMFEDTKQTMILAQAKADEANKVNPEIRATWKDFTDNGRPDATLIEKVTSED